MAAFSTTIAAPVPDLFKPHPHFSDEINCNIVQSEMEGGVHLRDLPPGTVLEVQTRNRVYTIVSERDGEAWISGHPVYCPDPVLVNIHGSTWGGSMIRERFIGRGLRLEFGHPDFQVIFTSRLVDVREKS
jgi:hypothetical protein